MNAKTAYLIPAFAAVLALAFSVAPAMAEYGKDAHDRSMGYDHKGMGHDHKMMHHHVKVEGFTGSIQVTEDSDKHALKDQVTVSLSEAASGLDVMGGHIGIVENENKETFVVWILKSVQMDRESGSMTVTIHVVDAADAANTATVTKEPDHYADKADRLDKKIDRLEAKFSEPSGRADVDAARATFLEKLQEMRDAIESGDSQRADELRKELKDLRDHLGSMKSFRQ